MIAASLRYFSGRLADRTRAYWAITILGYCVNLLVVPAMAFAGNWQMAALLVVAERTGKSLRGPARDVLLSEATGKVGHGWGFGVHAAMDQTGAVLGPLLMVVAVARAHHFAPAFLRLAFPAAGGADCAPDRARNLSECRGRHSARRQDADAAARVLDVRSRRWFAGLRIPRFSAAFLPF